MQCAYLWRRNEERASFWYVFPLINQGAWQDEQCRVCPELVRTLFSMESLMTECLLSNVFISMLPRNSEIAEHRGMTNARLRVHFGVEIPKDRESCFMLVGGEVSRFNYKILFLYLKLFLCFSYKYYCI